MTRDWAPPGAASTAPASAGLPLTPHRPVNSGSHLPIDPQSAFPGGRCHRDQRTGQTRSRPKPSPFPQKVKGKSGGCQLHSANTLPTDLAPGSQLGSGCPQAGEGAESLKADLGHCLPSRGWCSKGQRPRPRQDPARTPPCPHDHQVRAEVCRVCTPATAFNRGREGGRKAKRGPSSSTGDFQKRQ